GVTVSDFARAVSFYRGALEPLGYRLESEDRESKSAGFGKAGAPQLWLNEGKRTPTVHGALRAPGRKAGRGVHRAALAAGGKDNGAAGPRESYGPTYYAAFVFDPDGNNVEAVCLAPG